MSETVLDIVPKPELLLGSLPVQNPAEMIARAAELAKALSDILNSQKDAEGKPTMYVVIKGKKYVKAEGWSTMGAMLGVVPIEAYCKPLPEGQNGFKAKVKLVRIKDGMQVGGASAICKAGEKGWNPDDEFATHSKAITRATGKAFRLSFAWIMKLAGYEATPADELFEREGTHEEAQAAGEKEAARLKKVIADREKASQNTPKALTALSYTLPERHRGNYAEFNLEQFCKEHPDRQDALKLLFSTVMSKNFARTGAVLVPVDRLDTLLQTLAGDMAIDVKKLEGELALNANGVLTLKENSNSNGR